MSLQTTQHYLFRNCERCGREMKLMPKQVRARFCYECRAQHAIEHKRETRRAALRKMFSDCPACGKRFAQGNSYGRNHRNKLYCSTGCVKKAWKIRHRAKALAGAVLLTASKRYAGNYLPTLERDAWKCVKCGAATRMVHHLDNRGDKCTVLAKNHARENLISICEPCHRTQHKLDWAFDGEALIIKCEAFRPLLGTDTVRLSRKEVLI